MTLNHWWILHFLWLLPLAACALVVQRRKQQRALEQFADAELLNRLTAPERRGRRLLKGILVLTALSLILLALAGPRWGSHYQEARQKGVDIMILVDVSPSMLVEDLPPNRLERARREILDFLRAVEGDRVGLVAFAGAAFVQCPLTLDYAALQMFLNALQPDLVPVPGTDLGAAIETGLSAFDFNAATDKVMLLITDGEDNEARGREAARQAAAKDAKIFVFGIGDPSGGPIPAGNGQGGFKKDAGGQLILSKLDEAGLRQIASISGGTYVRSVAGDLDLDLLYFEGIKSRTEAQTLKSGKIKVYEERFSFFVLAAFLCLLLEGLIGTGVRSEMPPASRGSPGVARAGLGAVLGCWVFLELLGATPAQAAQTPDELYRQGRFSEAEKAYAQADMDHPKDVRYRYNRGCAAYQNSDYPGAAAAFTSVLRRAQDDDLRFKAAYNLGNTAYQQNDFAAARHYYRQALGFNPASEDARHNLELALRALDKQKQQQSDAPPPQSPQDNGRQEEPSDSAESKPGPDRPPDEGTRQRPSQEQAGDRQDPATAKRQAPQPRESAQAGTERNAEQDAPRDLTGDLKPRQNLPPPTGEQPSREAAMSMIDKKKAEALLDNINEDRTQFMRFQVPAAKRQGVASGKDW
ncbi:MAG: VWA domain-containing protein [Desulfobacterales bacterium]|nr:MAG: VWA domain-containing protein [Desulfobacterales bacterium]